MLLGIVDANRDGLDLMAGFEEQLCARSCLSIPLDIEIREFDVAAEGNEIYDTSSFYHRVMEPTHDGGFPAFACELSMGRGFTTLEDSSPPGVSARPPAKP
ncbi:hypothetical protein N7524_003948 [Penicillium chrysogenum]|nr:hypothetical protein N7524_003948 [Penicillium chrysogenum]